MWTDEQHCRLKARTVTWFSFWRTDQWASSASPYCPLVIGWRIRERSRVLPTPLDGVYCNALLLGRCSACQKLNHVSSVQLRRSRKRLYTWNQWHHGVAKCNSRKLQSSYGQLKISKIWHCGCSKFKLSFWIFPKWRIWTQNFVFLDEIFQTMENFPTGRLKLSRDPYAVTPLHGICVLWVYKLTYTTLDSGLTGIKHCKLTWIGFAQ